MNTYLLPLGLVLHISGIVLMAGTFFAGFLIDRQIWRHLPDQSQRALAINQATSPFRIAQAIGGLIILIGGLTMMTAVHGVFMHQTWFKIKLGVLALLIINMIIIERPAARKLKRLLNGEPDQKAIAITKSRLTFFYLLQLALFLVIFIISAYKFN